MYQIDKENNKVVELKKCTFSELGFKERENLQEWIEKEPSVLGEELLIIQKEFSGFDETQERLDLLALDKQGSLVIIENKLDDTGKDVTWQALKYASYCSGLSKENIRSIYQEYLDKTVPSAKAEEYLSDYFEGVDFEELSLNKGVTQRIILTAAKFRKEVTSTVLWLMNFKVRIQCFRVTPYSRNEELFLNVEQIIPTQDAEDYMIGMADKAQDEIITQVGEGKRGKVRNKFWTGLLNAMGQKPTKLFQNISPSNYAWIGAGTGVRGVGMNFAATKTYGRAEIYIDRGDKAENEFVFDELLSHKSEIENNFDGELVWERLDDKRACRIKCEESGNIFEEEQWDAMISFMTDTMVKMENVFKEPIKVVGQKVKQSF